MDYLKVARSLLESGYDIFAVRSDDREWQIGEEIPPSSVWDYENDCPSDENMNGVCATLIGEKWDDEEEILAILEERINFNKRYGTQQYLVGGSWGYEHGVDEFEIIIKGAEVITKL